MHDNGNLMIDGALVTAPFPVTNYRDDGEPHFWATRRISPLRHCVLHETAGRSAASAKRTLKDHPKHYGVHLILDRDGSLSQHADLASEVCVHANQLNATSVGIEIVNPYAPSLAYVDPIETIPARWWTTLSVCSAISGWRPFSGRIPSSTILTVTALRSPRKYCAGRFAWLGTGSSGRRVWAAMSWRRLSSPG